MVRSNRVTMKLLAAALVFARVCKCLCVDAFVCLRVCKLSTPVSPMYTRGYVRHRVESIPQLTQEHHGDTFVADLHSNVGYLGTKIKFDVGTTVSVNLPWTDLGSISN